MEKNNKYQITIGLEIHTQVNTFNKVFSQSLNSSTSQSNTCVNEIDLGLPGTLPFFNLDVLKKAIILAKALKMDINNTLAFNRKVYFHYDLPKGYQITQFGENTIAKNGIINLKNKTIRIEEFHIEEDTAKQTKENELNFLDYNRCGVGLIEIVTKPDFYLKEEVIEFLKQLKRLLIYLNISDGKMEESNLRVDVNISISNTESLGTRVEIKNLNSFNSVSKAIEHEFNRQKKILESGKAVIQETRKWNDENEETEFMREKKEQSEYFYNNETNILPFNISKIINLTFLEQEKLPQNIFDSLKKQNLPEFYIEQLLDDYDLYVFFISINNVINDVNLTSTWIIVELLKILNKNNIKILEISNSLKSNFLDLLLLIKKNEINQKQAKVLLEHLYASKKDVNQLIKELGMKQITNKNELEEIIMKILNNNKEMILQNKERVERIEKFIIGLVMKETKGQANPNIVKNLFDKLILCFI